MAKSTEHTDLFRVFRAFRGLTAVFRLMKKFDFISVYQSNLCHLCSIFLTSE